MLSKLSIERLLLFSVENRIKILGSLIKWDSLQSDILLVYKKEALFSYDSKILLLKVRWLCGKVTGVCWRIDFNLCVQQWNPL